MNSIASMSFLVSYADKITQTEVERIRLTKVLANIKYGEYEKVVIKIRNEKRKEKRNELKKQLLPYFSPAKFNDEYRNNDNFLFAKSMIFDIDNLTNEALKVLKTKICKDKNVYACFVSPSGNGLKLIYKLSRRITNVQEFRDVYNNQSEHIMKIYQITVDNTSDASRACFVSYDPDLILHPFHNSIDVDANSVKVKNIYKKYTVGNRDISELPKIIDFLTGKINYDEWIRCGFSLASIGDEGKDYFINLSVNNPNYPDTKLMMDEKFNKMLSSYKENRTTIDSIYYLAKEKGYIIKHNYKAEFWRYESGKLEIISEGFLTFLENNGFCKIHVDNLLKLVHIINNRANIISAIEIRDFVRKYLKSINKYDIIQKLFNNVSTYLSENYLYSLNPMTIDFHQDTKTSSFIYYQNCYVEITKDKILIKDYSTLRQPIWEKDIIQRVFNMNKALSDFSRFISNVCNKSEGRKRTLRSAIGYLLHRYKNPSTPKSVILVDEGIKEGAYGRSGKSLIGDALSKVRCTVEIDGRIHNFQKSFPYQKVQLNTSLIFFNDVDKYFPFSRLFSSLTNGLEVEQKYKNAYTILFEKSPKFLITTNYVISGEDDSSKARKFEIEVSDYYNVKHQPINEFGKNFFIEWSENEWNSFDYYIMKCLKFYLKNGLIPYSHLYLNKKKLILETSPHFTKFIKTIAKNNKIDKKHLYNEFMQIYKDINPLFTQNNFTQWLKKYGELYGYEVKERPSNGKQMIVFKKRNLNRR